MVRISVGSKYSDYLGNPQLRRWLRNLERGSPVTAEVALRRISRSSELLGLSPKRLLRELEETCDLCGSLLIRVRRLRQ